MEIDLPLQPKRLFKLPILQLLIGIGVVSAFTVLVLPIQHFVQQGTAALLYIGLVLILAANLGRAASLLATLLAALYYSYFFVPAYRAFEIRSFQDGLRVAVFFVVAMLVSDLAGRARSRVELLTERARLSEETARATALAASDRLKSTILSSISHDLRTPLAVIKGAVTGLLDESVAWESAARRELLTTIDEETDRLNRLVRDLLEMSRIEAGALARSRSLCDLGELIESVVARLHDQWSGRIIEVDLPAELPPLAINYAQVDQVLTNLLENGLCYGAAERPVTMRAVVEAPHMRIEVLDRGPGVPYELREAIFEKFMRAVPAERHAGGSGLGLAICKGLVEAHNGRIWVEDRPGGGACFVVILPLAAPLVQPAYEVPR